MNVRKDASPTTFFVQLNTVRAWERGYHSPQYSVAAVCYRPLPATRHAQILAANKKQRLYTFHTLSPANCASWNVI